MSKLENIKGDLATAIIESDEEGERIVLLKLYDICLRALMNGDSNGVIEAIADRFDKSIIDFDNDHRYIENIIKDIKKALKGKLKN